MRALTLLVVALVFAACGGDDPPVTWDESAVGIIIIDGKPERYTELSCGPIDMTPTGAQQMLPALFIALSRSNGTVCAQAPCHAGKDSASFTVPLPRLSITSGTFSSSGDNSPDNSAYLRYGNSLSKATPAASALDVVVVDLYDLEVGARPKRVKVVLYEPLTIEGSELAAQTIYVACKMPGPGAATP